MIKTDFQQVFRAAPANYLVLDLDYSIVEVTDYHLMLLERKREDILNKNLFEAYPVNPDNSYSVANLNQLHASLDYVKEHKITHQMEVLRYDVPADNGFETRYWLIKNIPVFKDGVLYRILDTAIDITELTKIGNIKN